MGNAATVRLHEKFGLAQRVINFRPYGDLDADFLVLQLLSLPFQEILDATATGLTAKGIKAAKLKRLPLAIPPIPEQRRIVAKVNQLMVLCDQLDARLTTNATARHQFLEATLEEGLVSWAIRAIPSKTTQMGSGGVSRVEPEAFVKNSLKQDSPSNRSVEKLRRIARLAEGKNKPIGIMENPTRAGEKSSTPTLRISYHQKSLHKSVKRCYYKILNLSTTLVSPRISCRWQQHGSGSDHCPNNLIHAVPINSGERDWSTS